MKPVDIVAIGLGIIVLIIYALIYKHKKRFRSNLKVGQKCLYQDKEGNWMPGEIAFVGEGFNNGISEEKQKVCIDTGNNLVWKGIDEVEPQTVISKKF